MRRYVHRNVISLGKRITIARAKKDGRIGERRVQSINEVMGIFKKIDLYIWERIEKIPKPKVIFRPAGSCCNFSIYGVFL